MRVNTNVPEFILDEAEYLAAKSDMHQKMAAIVYVGDEILGSDYNRWMGSSRLCLYGVPVWSRHCEIGAIRRVYKHYGSKGFEGSSIYVHRLGFRSARPCSHCMQVIKMMGIVKVYWSGDK